MSTDELIIVSGNVTSVTIFALSWWLIYRIVQAIESSRRRTYSVCVGACFAFSLLVFGYFFWPTPWRQWATEEFDYRTDRMTGKIELGTGIGSGWEPITDRTEADIRKADRADSMLKY